MKTKIYKNYSEFIERENKEENGVSEQFAIDNPEWDKYKSNKGCWNCSYCSDCRGCSNCSSCSDCSYCSSCSDCSYCSDCRGCSYCSDCRGCRGCSYCSDCRGCTNTKGDLIIPKIENIHQKVLEAVTKPNALDMSSWHTCETTHCRAGWVVTLAGKEGKDLEQKTSTLFAAMTIYNKSSKIKVHIPKYFDTNDDAMEDIKKCAKKESKV